MPLKEIVHIVSLFTDCLASQKALQKDKNYKVVSEPLLGLFIYLFPLQHSSNAFALITENGRIAEAFFITADGATKA